MAIKNILADQTSVEFQLFMFDVHIRLSVSNSLELLCSDKLMARAMARLTAPCKAVRRVKIGVVTLVPLRRVNGKRTPKVDSWD